MRKEHIFKIGDKRPPNGQRRTRNFFLTNTVFEFLRISVREIP